MKEIIKFNDEVEFRNNIFEISSISLDTEYNKTSKKVDGYFIITGSYRGHEISLNQENFTKKIPFNYEFNDELEEESITLEVNDFTYEIDQNKLILNIEYEIEGDKMLFEDEREFDKFLEEHEVEIVDLKEESKEEESKEEEIKEEKEIIEPIIEENISQIRTSTKESEIIDTLKDGENTYITYHIHICDESDTLDYLANKYKINIELIKEYNSIDEIRSGMKLIIPCLDE